MPQAHPEDDAWSERHPSVGSCAPPHPVEKLLARRHVARIFGVSVSTVTRWAQQGRLPSIRTSGGHYRFSEATVREACRV